MPTIWTSKTRGIVAEIAAKAQLFHTLVGDRGVDGREGQAPLPVVADTTTSVFVDDEFWSAPVASIPGGTTGGWRLDSAQSQWSSAPGNWPITIAGWAYLDASGDGGTLFGWGSTAYAAWISVFLNRVYTKWQTNGYFVTPSSSLAHGRWYHIAIKWDDGSAKTGELWIDGVKAGDYTGANTGGENKYYVLGGTNGQRAGRGAFVGMWHGYDIPAAEIWALSRRENYLPYLTGASRTYFIPAAAVGGSTAFKPPSGLSLLGVGV